MNGLLNVSFLFGVSFPLVIIVSEYCDDLKKKKKKENIGKEQRRLL